MTFNLDFALFYAYTLCLFAFLLFWVVPRLFRAVMGSGSLGYTAREIHAEEAPASDAVHRTRLEAFTRF